VETLLSTHEAARLAGVGPTSVKRWADLGFIECRKTPGGHRRFERLAFERFLREKSSPSDDATSVWLERLLHADGYALRAALYDARSRLGAWHRVADELGPAITALGDRWECGDVTVLDEHVASERISRALSHIADGMPVGENGPSCLLACAEGDEHTLGLSLVELCLREAGWATVWAGRRTPAREIAAAVTRGDYFMVALSASVSSAGNPALANQAELVARACVRESIPLVLGGGGPWPAALRGASRFTAFGPFYDFSLARLRATLP